MISRNKSTFRSGRALLRSSSKNKSCFSLVFRLFLRWRAGVILLTLFLLLLYMVLVNHKFSGTETKSQRDIVDSKVSFDHAKALVPRSDQEDVFYSTLKSCIPSINKCQSHRYENKEGRKISRVALLSPPGPMSDAFADWILAKIDSIDGLNMKDTVFVYSSHVPPYGYGKNHGWTKIIRWIPVPIAMGLADVTEGNEISEDKDALSQLLSQIIRWHCRLSHVAAHTEMLTLTLQLNDKIEKLDSVFLEQIYPFLFEDGANNNYPKKLNLSDRKASKEDNAQKIEALGTMNRTFLDKQRNLLKKLTDFEQHNQNDDMKQILDKVLSDELTKSKNLSKWPCCSFWKFPNHVILSESAKQLGKKLAPECTNNHFVRCTVELDFCEEKADSKCNQKNVR